MVSQANKVEGRKKGKRVPAGAATCYSDIPEGTSLSLSINHKNSDSMIGLGDSNSGCH